MRVERVDIHTFEKRLSSRELAEPEARVRLRDEATLLAALGGTVTPKLVGTGEDERGPWLRMERIPFPTLATRLAGPTLAPAWIERATRAAFHALAELHEARDASGPLLVVHADISASNLALDDDGTRAVLLDLELATWRGSAARDGAFRGTVGTCAPEVARGEAPTVASDLFALAATLLHAAIGAPLRDGPSLAALLAVAAERPILDEPVIARLDLAARGPAHAALLRCLAHAPSDRPKTARAVLELLA